MIKLFGKRQSMNGDKMKKINRIRRSLGLFFILSLTLLGTLVWYDWKFAVLVFGYIWANNISKSDGR